MPGLLYRAAVASFLALSLAPCASAQGIFSWPFHKADKTPNRPPLPFTLDEGNATIPPVSLLPADRMSRRDQDLLANAESVIQEKAGFEALDFNGEGWTYQQIVCPALPGHLLVRYSRDDGTRQLSMFSAAIPRSGDGKVRIIPIVRKGYSLFSPAPINALTISAFNHIRAEESFERPPDWVRTGLCYVALTGGDPDFGDAAPQIPQDPGTSLAMQPNLARPLDGSAEIKFIARSTNDRPMLWTMTFDAKGVLTKAHHEPASGMAVRPSASVSEDPFATASRIKKSSVQP